MRNIKSKNVNAASELKEFANSNGFKIEVLDMDVTSDESENSAIAQIPEVDVLHAPSFLFVFLIFE